MHLFPLGYDILVIQGTFVPSSCKGVASTFQSPARISLYEFVAAYPDEDENREAQKIIVFLHDIREGYVPHFTFFEAREDMHCALLEYIATLKKRKLHRTIKIEVGISKLSLFRSSYMPDMPVDDSIKVTV